MHARSKRIVLSLTPDEKSLLYSLASYEGRLSLNAMLRHLIADAARQRGINPKEVTGDISLQDDVNGSS